MLLHLSRAFHRGIVSFSRASSARLSHGAAWLTTRRGPPRTAARSPPPRRPWTGSPRGWREPSIGAQIRRLLPKIEKAIESGATHEEIVATLRESGIAMSLATFSSALYRARKRAARGQGGGGRKGSPGTKGGGASASGSDPAPDGARTGAGSRTRVEPYG